MLLDSRIEATWSVVDTLLPIFRGAGRPLSMCTILLQMVYKPKIEEDNHFLSISNLPGPKLLF